MSDERKASMKPTALKLFWRPSGQYGSGNRFGKGNGSAGKGGFWISLLILIIHSLIMKVRGLKSGRTHREKWPILSVRWGLPARLWDFKISQGTECGNQIIGVQPEGDSRIPGIRRWPRNIYQNLSGGSRDRIIDVDQQTAENVTRSLASKEGIFAGVSSGGAVAAALRISEEVENAVIVVIICDRGDRYLSTGIFPA